ncbi:hypothetical protein DB346_24660 [Verrucomicrobia bacterium LW23]|nr:hypothetical protein DB346_24660 [Verrucomicrobia bacterium LW23]
MPAAEVPLLLPMHEWSCLRTELVWVYDAPIPSPVMTAVRNRGHFAWFVRSGCVRLTTAAEQAEITPGMWCFLPEGECRSECPPGTHIVSLHFVHEWPSGVNFVSSDRIIAFPGAEHPELERGAVRMDRLVRQHFGKGGAHRQGRSPAAARPEAPRPYHRLQAQQLTDPRIFLRLQALFLTWLGGWLEVHLRRGSGWTRLRSGDDRPLRAARLLNEAPLSEPFPRNNLHQATGLSDVHLNRLFVQEFAMSPRRYWDLRRLRQSQQWLETSLMPVKEMAYRLGFLSDSHFATWFRRQTGRRPAEIREGAAK